MRTYELVSNYTRSIFNVYETTIESHVDLFDSHKGGNLFPSIRKIFTLEDLKYMGVTSTEHFISKTTQRESKFREITGPYANQINETYNQNRELYPL